MGKSSKTTQENKPPAWAEPILKEVAQTGLDLYNSGTGYNVYTGQTQAPLSDVTLGGMNNMLAATGYRGAPVSNESINANVPDIRSMIEAAAAQNQQAKAQSASSNSPQSMIPEWVRDYLERGTHDQKAAANKWVEQNYHNPLLTPDQWDVRSPAEKFAQRSR